MSSWYSGNRPITIAILAMGGEGGGVLADWIVDLGETAGYTAQTTSVAGVAQRTGATVYYLELLPPAADDTTNGGGTGSVGGHQRSRPVLSLFPAPGQVDIVIASELMEAGRAIQRGFSTPDRTVLISSTSRVYSMAERIAMGDGIVDPNPLLAAAHAGSRRFIAGDFMSIAVEAQSVISASLFGALAGSGELPFTRSEFEDAIRKSGRGVEASLLAFDRGFTASGLPAPQPETPSPTAVPVTLGRKPSSASSSEDETERAELAATQPEKLVGPGLAAQAKRVGSSFPKAARSMLLRGCERTAVYQDTDYTDTYLDRVERIAALDPDTDGAARLTTEAARYIALWMCYQDTIHVAQQKIRKARLDNIRDEARADKKQLLNVHEYLHPQMEEITDTMSAKLGRRMSNSKIFARLVGRLTSKGLTINTTSIHGYTMLWTMASMRPMRPRSFRFQREQAAIEEWLDLAAEVATQGNTDLATEIIECQRVIKGYGQTHAHGTESFERLMAAARVLNGQEGAAQSLAGLRAAALADEDGATLEAAVANLQPA